MKTIKTDIPGLLILQPDVFFDPRGYFYESYSKQRYKAEGIDYEFVQNNISKSVKGTLRGLHYQAGNFAQGKLCQVISGSVLDVAVDIRYGSPTYGKYFSIILSEQAHNQLWIPPGFAHGFSVLSEEAVFSYLCTNYYNKESERTIIYNDKNLNINWQVDNPIVSEKDLKGKAFNQIQKDFIF